MTPTAMRNRNHVLWILCFTGLCCLPAMALAAAPSLGSREACSDPSKVLAELRTLDLPVGQIAGPDNRYDGLVQTRTREIHTPCAAWLRQAHGDALWFETGVRIRPGANGGYRASFSEERNWLEGPSHPASGPDGELLMESPVRTVAGRAVSIGLWRSEAGYRVSLFSRIPGAPRPASTILLLESSEPIHSIQWMAHHHASSGLLTILMGDSPKVMHRYTLDLASVDTRLATP